MVSLNQLDKVREMQTQGWSVVPWTTPISARKLGGPIMMVKDDKHVLVYASSELVEPTADEIAGW